jgi:hypothetical protein
MIGEKSDYRIVFFLSSQELEELLTLNNYWSENFFLFINVFYDLSYNQTISKFFFSF